MTEVPNRETFENAYQGRAPWDIGRPQRVLIDAAPRVQGSVLDVGCGTGENALFFAARGHAVTGLDHLSEPIVRARRKAAERNLAVDFLVFDALRLNELPRTFDTAIDSGLFHVFADADRQTYVAGLSGVVRAGGKLLLVCFSDEEPGTIGPRRVSERELRSVFADGWTVLRIEPARFEVIPDLPPDVHFSPGGPKAWFAELSRNGA